MEILTDLTYILLSMLGTEFKGIVLESTPLCKKKKVVQRILFHE